MHNVVGMYSLRNDVGRKAGGWGGRGGARGCAGVGAGGRGGRAERATELDCSRFTRDAINIDVIVVLVCVSFRPRP